MKKTVAHSTAKCACCADLSVLLSRKPGTRPGVLLSTNTEATSDTFRASLDQQAHFAIEWFPLPHCHAIACVRTTNLVRRS